jgi:DNA-binding beta-propeller fold protein YncE
VTRVAPLIALIFAACAPSPTSASPTSAGAAQVFIFSNSSPHITVFDANTRKILRMADVPNLTAWSINDDQNYSDGKVVWLAERNVDTDDVQMLTLDLDSLQVRDRLPLGKDKLNIFHGKATRDGVLLVAKQASAQVVGIDTKNPRVVSTWDVPVNGGVACDADVGVGADGVERFFYPTREGNTLVSVDPKTGKTLTITEIAKGITPWMLTTAPDKKTVWVMEDGDDTNGVFDMTTLVLLKRFPTGKGPYVTSFSPDGKYAFIGHRRDTVLAVYDAKTFDEVQRVTLGTNPRNVAVDPASKFAWVTITREHTVAVVEIGTWKIVDRIDLGAANPDSIWIRPGR